MIRSITGELLSVGDTAVTLAVGPVVFELLVPSADVLALQGMIGQDVTFHTIFELQGDASRGGLTPALVGFLRPEDRKFFEIFTDVPGIGTRKALKALSVPFGEVASAVESGDTRFLIGLPQIGKRLAETIIATLSGKLGTFALEMKASSRKPLSRLSVEEEDAVTIMSSPQMGLKRFEAEQLLERVKRNHPALKTADEFVPEMLRLHAGR